MKHYALSIANEMVAISLKKKQPITMLKLMKLTYIAHGFILAILDKPTDGLKLDKVEAWMLGPVFPTVYYAFRNYGKNDITTMATDLDFEGATVFDIVTPRLTDPAELHVCDWVFKAFGGFSAKQLVGLLHKPNTPWSVVYQYGMNNLIPDYVTKKYYKGYWEYLKERNLYAE